jgi:hypothetical protein
METWWGVQRYSRQISQPVQINVEKNRYAVELESEMARSPECTE